MMIDDGLFEGHRRRAAVPPLRSDPRRDAIRSRRRTSRSTFTGLQAHASSDPWRGRNALDALIALFVSVGLWRQQLRPTARVHGIIREGGTAANIIPDRTSAWFMIRADNEPEYEAMRERFRQLCEAAAQASDTTVEVTFSGRATTMRNNLDPGRAVPGEHGGLRLR